MWQCSRSHEVKTGMKRTGFFFPEVILQSTIVLGRNSKAVYVWSVWSLFCPYSLLRLWTVVALLLAHLITAFFYRLLNRQYCSAAAKNCTTELRNTKVWLLIFKILYPQQFFSSYLKNVSLTHLQVLSKSFSI